MESAEGAAQAAQAPLTTSFQSDIVSQQVTFNHRTGENQLHNTHQVEVSTEQQIRKLTTTASRRSQNALIRKILGLGLSQWEKLLCKLRNYLIERIRGLEIDGQLSKNENSRDRWLRWVIADLNGWWSNHPPNPNL